MFKKKLLVITDAPYAFSGYGNQVDKIMTEMVKRGWDVYAFACNYFPNGKEEKDENGYVVFNGIKTILLEDIWNGPEYLYPSKEKVKNAMDEINPDIVFTLNDFYRVAPYLELGPEFINKWVHWLPIDNDYDDKYTPQFENQLKNLVFITEFGKRMESPKTPDVEYIDMVYHGINSEEFKPVDKDFVKKINNNTGKFVITTVARHQPRKMVYHTAKAVFKFLQKHPDAIWICKTDPLDSSMRNHPEDERDLISLAAKNGVSSQVIYVNAALPVQQLNDLYNNGDIFITLTGGEGFNIPLAESMMAGVPCIVTASTTGPELLDGGRLGYLVPVKTKKSVGAFNIVYDIADIDYAVNCLEKCYMDWKTKGGELEFLGKECRKFALEHFALNKIVDRWEAIFNRMYQNVKNNKTDEEANYLVNTLYGLTGTVVDIGCETGELVKKLNELGIDAYGIDSNPVVLNYIDDSVKDKIFIESSSKMSASDKEYNWGLVIDLLNVLSNDDLEKTLQEIKRTCNKAYIRINYDNRGKDWWGNKIQQSGLDIIANRNNEFIVKEKSFVPESIKETDRFIVGIPTKDRVRSLWRTLDSLIGQTVSNFDVIIADDSRYDHLIDDEPLQKIIEKLNKKGVHVFLFLAHGINQADAHNKILNQAKMRGSKLVFRCDDDVTLEPTHLERLFKEFVKDKECKYAAMGGIILNPGNIESQKIPTNWRELPEFAGTMNPCVLYAQTFKYPDNIEYRDDIQHLYSSYMYRTVLMDKVGGFPVNLSSVAYREETLGLYELYLQGYKMKIVTKAFAMHWHESAGGCRSIDGEKARKLYEKDEKKFYESLKELYKKYSIN